MTMTMVASIKKIVKQGTRSGALLLFLFGVFFLGGGIEKVNANFAPFTLLLQCPVNGPCTQAANIGGSISIDSSTYFAGQAITVSAELISDDAPVGPDCPAVTVSINNSFSNPIPLFDGSGFPCVGVGMLPAGVTGSVVLTAPTTPGNYVLHWNVNKQSYASPSFFSPIPFTVVAPAVGTVNVSANIPGANWTISGPANFSGSGTTGNFTGRPIGLYTITWGAVSGFTTPMSSSQTLVSNGGPITFTGTYTAITPPSVQLNFQ